MTNARPLLDEDFRVDADVRIAETLPARAFLDSDYQRLELETLFERSWLLVPEHRSGGGDERSLSELLMPRGARVPFTLLGRPHFLQRGWDDDTLRCFPNTCTHAWYPLVLGPSRGPSLTCGQHGRKFSCDGSFVSQPGFDSSLPGFPRDCDHLPAMPVAAWRDFLFTCLGTPDASLGEVLAPLQASVARMGLEDLRRRGGPVELRDVEGNWKLHAWNYMDKFHLVHVHRAPGGLADAIDLASYRTELHGRSALQWAYARNPAHGFAPEQLPARFADAAGRRVFALWWLVFPNLALNFYPWGLSVNCWMPVPGEPERTLFAWHHHVLDDQLHARRDEIWLNDQVDREDVDALAQVKRGLRSGRAPRGRFAPDEEAGPHWFHRAVYDAVFRGALG